MEQKWFETFFRGPAVQMWIEAIPAEATAAEIDAYWTALNLAPGARVLDAPCGHGRHARELARRGCRVTGVDLSTEFLDAARRLAAADGVTVDWREGDLRSFAAGDGYDAALCLGNSYGYLDADESESFLAAVARSLKPGGGFALDTGVAAESILANAEKRQWHLAGSVYLLSEARYDARESRLDTDYTFLWEGRSETRPSSSYVATAGEIRRRLERAGFRVESMTAGPGGAPYALGSPYLVIAAFRR